jgi:hypothetical protein
MRQTLEYQRIYIRDTTVKEFRDVTGIQNLSGFVRQCIEDRVNEARAGSPNTSPELPPLKEANNS